VHFRTTTKGNVMKGIKISAAIVGAALSVGGLSLAPVDGAAHARSSSGACLKLIGVGHTYTVVAYPCALQGLGQATPHRKQLPAVDIMYAV